MVYCRFFSLESPNRGDSNEYTQNTIFTMKKKNNLNYPKSPAMGFFSMGLKNEFETAVVNESSVFEPLKFYCIRDIRLGICKKLSIGTDSFKQTVQTQIRLLLKEQSDLGLYCLSLRL